jgi:hypothetical protein
MVSHRRGMRLGISRRGRELWSGLVRTSSSVGKYMFGLARRGISLDTRWMELRFGLHGGTCLRLDKE